MPLTLLGRHNPLASSSEQLKVLEQLSTRLSFEAQLNQAGLYPLCATGITVFQINVGKLCNQTCRHCHVDAGPDRPEAMSLETAEQCIEALAKTDIPTVDITHRVEIIASLPSYRASQTDAQRGEGIFEKSLEALRLLNRFGYGRPDSGLTLNLVYNPVGAFLPPRQEAIEAQFKKELRTRHDIEFNRLYAITNMPISRFLEFLVESGNYDQYMTRLANAFNPAAAAGVMCRYTLSVGWDGRLYDCDFNQMLDLPVDHGAPPHIRDFDPAQLHHRRIVTRNHCYGCTAGSGSSCGGTVR
jgi:MoaA/NifB/PqqE/SkfB family radical SAM enzyme